jgi:starch synthase
MASLLPLYLREYYKNDPLFSDSKIVTSIYNNDFKGTLGDDLIEKIKFDSISEEKLKSLSKVNHTNLIKIAIENSDAVIKGSENIPEELENHIKEKQVPVLEFQSSEDYSETYSNFYLTEVL